MRFEYGLPVIGADDVFDILAELGIVSWTQTGPDENLADFCARNPGAQALDEARRFAPKTIVRHLQAPDGKSFNGYCADLPDWATTFAMLPGGLVVLSAECKHGAGNSGEVILVPPSGTPNREDLETGQNMMKHCAFREFEEETGLKLANIEPLGGLQYASARNTTFGYYPFLGTVAEPIVLGPTRRDKDEHMATVLCPLDEWLTLIERGRGIEQCSASITLLALRHLGLIRAGAIRAAVSA